jgi:hypothetical protein
MIAKKGIARSWLEVALGKKGFQQFGCLWPNGTESFLSPRPEKPHVAWFFEFQITRTKV